MKIVMLLLLLLGARAYAADDESEYPYTLQGCLTLAAHVYEQGIESLPLFEQAGWGHIYSRERLEAELRQDTTSCINTATTEPAPSTASFRFGTLLRIWQSRWEQRSNTVLREN